MTRLRLLGPLAALGALAACATAQQPQTAAPRGELPRQHAPRPTTAAITEQDLMTRLYIFADDSMQGRATGTEGYRKGTDYIAGELRRLGLQPAGENGTFFQSMPSRAIGAATRLSAGGGALTLWDDYLPLLGPGMPRAIEGAATVYGGALPAYTNSTATPPLSAGQVAGRVVVLSLPADASLNTAAINMMLRGPLAGAAAVAIAGLEQASPQLRANARRASFGLGTDAQGPYAVLVSRAAAQRLLGADPAALQPGAAGPTVTGAIVVERGANDMARNVVAVFPGSDAALRGTYVALGAHADHVGINPRPVDHDSLKAFNAAAWQAGGASNDARPLSIEQRQAIRVNVDSLRAIRPPRPDSISNGADDDGSGSMALLEIAEALAQGERKPRRSVLFVWHAAEELGLLGARHFVDNPTVPRDSIVAHVNIDMIGRGGADDLVNGGDGYVGLIGASRLSRDFGDLTVRVNEAGRHGMRFDYGMDADGHSQQIYCRSDHVHYARHGIPSAFFFTGLHGDYHQVTDEPQYINYPNYARITNYIHDLVVTVADRAERLALSVPKPDPGAACRQ